MNETDRLASLERMLAKIEERLTEVESKLSELISIVDEDAQIFAGEINSIKTLLMSFESRMTRVENLPRDRRKIVKCFSV